MRTYEFNEFRQFPILSRQKEREILLINQLNDTIVEDNTPPYIATHKEKEMENSEFGSETNSESNLKTAQRQSAVDIPVNLSTD